MAACLAAVSRGDQPDHQRDAHEHGVIPLALHLHTPRGLPPGDNSVEVTPAMVKSETLSDALLVITNHER